MIRRIKPLWGHPAIAGKHIVSRTRDYPDGRPFSVATCPCGWTFRAEVTPQNSFVCDSAVEDHWRDVIARSEGAAA